MATRRRSPTRRRRVCTTGGDRNSSSQAPPTATSDESDVTVDDAFDYELRARGACKYPNQNLPLIRCEDGVFVDVGTMFKAADVRCHSVPERGNYGHRKGSESPEHRDSEKC